MPRPVWRVGVLCAGFSGSVASLSLLGWSGLLPALRNWWVGGVFMNPLTALLIVGTSMALWLECRPPLAWRHRLALALSGLVALLAASKLVSVWYPSLFAVDRIFFRTQLGTNQMAPNTAAALLMLALSLLTDQLRPALHRLSQALTIGAGAIAGVSVLGYFYGASSLYSVGRFIPMAFNTAVALVFLSAGIGGVIGRGLWIRLSIDRGAAGLLMRRLIPAAVILPALLGWVRLLGSRAGYYPEEIGVALMVVSTIGIFGSLGVAIVLAVQRLEGVRAEAERIAQQKIKLETEVVERQRSNEQLQHLNRELAVARDAAVEASRLKSAILANVSHEFRTPLTVIMGYINLLRGSTPPGEETAEILNTLEESARRLHALIDDFIALASIEAGVLQVTNDWFDIVPMLESTIESSRRLIESNGNLVVVDLSEAGGSLYSDQEKLQRALTQLLTNAGKFTSRGTITIAARRDSSRSPQCLEVSVTDTGIGIPPEHLEKLFKPFTQIDDSPSRPFGGVGLGLVLARRLCLILGGDLSVRSRIGEGSRFLMRIPVAPPSSAL